MKAALKLFSERGYSGVSMREIAADVGIKAASIYNHFHGKEDIFQALLDLMSEHYKASMQVIGLPAGWPEENTESEINAPTPAKAGTAGSNAGFYADININHLQLFARQLFLYMLKDDFAARVRRMLTLEQYRDSAASEAFHRWMFEEPLTYQSTLFRELIDKGFFIETDPDTCALHFYAPIYLLLSSYDHRPEREEEALGRLYAHIEAFAGHYVKN
ncbi:MAG: helix-turn-helix domain containing protein [Eubacteriales bacterium]|nr:helix-turn-helix domain containing protein [Eubacteriales bacterium]